MNIKRLVTDKKGNHRLGKWITLLGAITMSAAFIKESATNSLEWLDYIGYGIGITIIYAPAKATDLIYAAKGLPQHTEEARDDEGPRPAAGDPLPPGGN